MKKYRNLKISIGLIFAGCFLFSVASFAQGNPSSEKPELIFQTGFEGSSRVVPDLSTNDYGAHFEYITGVDNTLSRKNDWDKDWRGCTKSGTFQLQYTGGDSTKRYAKIIAEPGNPKNKVLQFWMNDSWHASEGQQKARIQANIYGVKDGFKEFYQSVRVFLSNDFNVLKNYPQKITWLTISEFWNNEWWVATEKHGFRISLGIGKPTGDKSDLNFILDSQDTGFKTVWSGDNTKLKVPIGKWFTMEYYFKEGNKETGQFYMAVTPDGEPRQVAYDIHNFTHNTNDPSPDGLTGYNPIKLYTSKEVVAYVKSQGKTLQIYWDDFKLWKNKRPKQ